MQKTIESVMQKEMSRGEFLATMGFGIASVFGFSNLIRLLTGKSLSGQLGIRASSGYGSTAYGGGKESR